jgi:hypothetical protein
VEVHSWAEEDALGTIIQWLHGKLHGRPGRGQEDGGAAAASQPSSKTS